MDHYTSKTKKNTYTGFELFRVKERGIPIEVLNLQNKNDKVVAFAWEPQAHRFAIIHQDDGPRPDSISFYSMKGASVTKLTTLKGRQANALYWSPRGSFIILAGLKAIAGQLEFYNVDDLETMATAEHFMATNVDWDPSGRSCATSVTSVHQMENGFNMWSFYGKLLYRLPRDKFFQFMWRPRPPTLLSPGDEVEIAKNLKAYSKKYEADDLARSLEGTMRNTESRQKLMEEWTAWMAEWRAAHEAEREEHLMLRDSVPSDTEEDIIAEVVEVEEIVSIEEDVLGFGFEQTSN